MIDIVDLIFLVIILILTFQILTLLKKIMKEEKKEITLIYGQDLFFNRESVRNHVIEGIKRYKYILYPILDAILEGKLNYYVVLAISAWETGWLSSPDAKNFVVNNNNIFGITKSNGKAFKFNSVNDCISYLLWLLQQKRYEKAWYVRFQGEMFITKLRECGYNPNLSWEQGVILCYKKIINLWNEV